MTDKHTLPSWPERILYRFILSGLNGVRPLLGPQGKQRIDEKVVLIRSRNYRAFWARSAHKPADFTSPPADEAPVAPPQSTPLQIIQHTSPHEAPPSPQLQAAWSKLIDQTSTLHIDADTQVLNAQGEIETITHAPLAQSTPLISVIIPCFNYGKYLTECVESVLEQTFTNFEVIIVDDASTDPHTIDVVDFWLASGRVTVIAMPSNSGLPAVRNTGIEAAKGAYIVCIDADDMLDPVYLEVALACLLSDTSIGFAYPSVFVFGAESHVWPTQDFDPFLARRANHVAVCGIYRKVDWALVGGFTPRMHGGYDDWEFWIRLAQLGRRGKAIDEPLMIHRKHGSVLLNMTNRALQKRHFWLETMRELSPRFYQDDQFTARLSKLSGLPKHHETPIWSIFAPETSVPQRIVFLTDDVDQATYTHIANHLSDSAHDPKNTIIIATGTPRWQALKSLRKLFPHTYCLKNFLPEHLWVAFINAKISSAHAIRPICLGTQVLPAKIETTFAPITRSPITDH